MMMYLVLFRLIRWNYLHRHHHRIHRCHPKVDWLGPVVDEGGRKIDYDDERKSIVMERRALMEDDQDLLEMVDNFFGLQTRHSGWKWQITKLTELMMTMFLHDPWIYATTVKHPHSIRTKAKSCVQTRSSIYKPGTYSFRCDCHNSSINSVHKGLIPLIFTAYFGMPSTSAINGTRSNGTCFIKSG